jgi:hypothetical protein
VNTERGVENTEFSIWSLDFYLWCDRYPETQNPEWDESVCRAYQGFHRAALATSFTKANSFGDPGTVASVCASGQPAT